MATTNFEQNVKVTGDLTATNYIGNGSQLTGVSGSASKLDELTDVSTAGVQSGYILKYNGTSWTTADESGGAGGGDVTAVNAGTGITGGGVSGNLTINVDVGTSANKIVQLDSNAKLPAVDGSALTNVISSAAMNNLTDVSTAGVTSGQVLKYNGTSWAAADDSISGGGALGDITVSGSTLSSSGATITLDDNVVVSGTLTSSQAGAPIFTSASTLTLQATTRTTIANTPIKLASFTTTDRNALTSADGDMIYNKTTNKFQGFANGAWVDLH